jgi:hypothetical protein
VEEFLEERRARTEPVLEGFRGWLDKHLLSTNKKFLIGKAVGYAGSQWSKLTAYLDCVELTPDNNVSENAIRPFCDWPEEADSRGTNRMKGCTTLA